jgi:5S rRNA maturation endonuclease (ribonuclease M5)
MLELALETVLWDAFGRLSSGVRGRWACPVCGPSRRHAHSRERDLAVLRDDQTLTYYCHHCGTSGAVRWDELTGAERLARTFTKRFSPMTKNPFDLNQPMPSHSELVHTAEAWLEQTRGIRRETWKRAGVTIEIQQGQAVVSFPVTDPTGFVVGAKHRHIDSKRFSYRLGTPSIVSDIASVKADPDWLILVEGEMDRLAVLDAGLENVLSCPGAAGNEQTRPRYLAAPELRKLLTTKFVLIAVDADGAGDTLATQLRDAATNSTRLAFPAGIKDANQMLMEQGREALGALLRDALARQVSASVLRPSDIMDRILLRYQQGARAGLTTGLRSVDSLFSWQVPLLIILTGWPASGKSVFLDYLCWQAWQLHSWRSVFCSFEVPTEYHVLRLISLETSLPLFSPMAERPSADRIRAEIERMQDHFTFLDFTQAESAPPTIPNILAQLRANLRRTHAKIVVLDPWNYVDLTSDRYHNESAQISSALTQLKLFAQQENIALVVIAHPQKLPLAQKRNGHIVPNGQHILGSSAWGAKADVGLTVDREDHAQSLSDIYCWKLRWHELAREQPVRLKTTLSYDKEIGAFEELPEVNLNDDESFEL